MNTELLSGWRKASNFRGDETYLNDQREMMVITNAYKSVLVKENEIYLTFTDKTHFSDALRESDEIYAKDYAKPH